MKVSIITACYNNESTITDALKSVASQSYDNIEHIVVDGASSDKTVALAKTFRHVSTILSEPDKGIYDALNKGLDLATGDVIGFLHSDDYFHDNDVVQKIVDEFEAKPQVDCVYGDIVFINSDKKVIRYYSSKQWTPNKFQYGRMPAHTSFFAKKKVYDKHHFDLSYRIAGDFEQLIRILYVDRTPYSYIELIATSMRLGGASTDGFRSNLTINKEILRACLKHGIKTNYFKIYSKYFKKVFEFLKKN